MSDSPPLAQSAPTRVRLQVAGWLSVMAALAYLCRFSIGVSETTIRTDLGLTEDQMALILGPAFFWSYALAQIPASRFGASFGARLCLPCFACVWSVATALFGVVSWYPLLLVIWMCVGIAQAGAFPVATQTLAAWFPKSERALATGTLVSLMHVGAAVGAGLTGVLLQWISWRLLFVVFAIPGLCWAAGFFRWFRNQPEQHPETNDDERQLLRHSAAAPTDRGQNSNPWRVLVRSRAVWLICGQQYCRAAGIVFFGSWFATYLQESRQITVAKSGLLLILPHIAIATASLVGGGVGDWIYRRTGSLGWSRKGLAVASMLLCTGLITITTTVSDATLAVVIISAGFFCAGLAGPGAYAVTMDIGGPHVLALFATMNMIGNLGAGSLPILVPPLRRWVQETPWVLGWCQGDSWNAVIALIAILHLAAAVCWVLTPLDRPALTRPPAP